MAKLLECLAAHGIDDLSAETTDSVVFVKRIMDGALDELGVHGAMNCFNNHRGVWPPGDSNNP